jgi:[FeFe] hydrogenase H-cluster maturation GTPase HydF
MKSLKQNRLHIGFFGKTNVGKSSLINKIAGQDVSIVSDIAGTTTDVVEKSMELLPIGPITLIDTAGLDDTTELAEKRIEKTLKVLDRTNIAVIVCEPDKFDDYEKDLIKELERLEIPYLIIFNKCDEAAKNEGTPSPDGERICGRTERSESGLRKDGAYCGEATNAELLEQRANSRQGWDGVISRNKIENLQKQQTDINSSTLQPFNFSTNYVYTSIFDSELISKFKQSLIPLLPDDFVNPPKIAGDLIPEKSMVILVTPIDKEAPKGRLILPQVQTIRDLLDSNCLVLTVKESELKQALDSLKEPPALVITDSQAFKKVSEIVPENIPLTSFSILFARLKGDLGAFIEGAKAIESLKDGDKVLILESCTHHAIEDDIGRVKIPNLLRKKTGKNLIIENFAGHDFPDISEYKLIIHCGACMTNRREVLSRIIKANEKNIPMTNYGITISYCLGILPRAVKIFTSKI